jgi:sugar O-acyltransferase (sialic acid O-acetyltransferase NeuD family)
MRTKKVFVYGSGGHGKVLADMLLTARVAGFAGFVDDDEKAKGKSMLGFRVLGNGAWLKEQAAVADVEVVLGIGDNSARRVIAERCRAWGAALRTTLHPSAVVARSARLGSGTVVMAHATINPDADLAEGAIVNTGAVVEHDVRAGAFSHLSPNSTMGGAAQIGELSLLGTGGVILPGITVGARCIVGAGAVVVENLPDNVVATGVPAKITRHIPGTSQAGAIGK